MTQLLAFLLAFYLAVPSFQASAQLAHTTHLSTPSQEEQTEVKELKEKVEKTHEELETTDKFASHLEQEVIIMLGVATLVIAVLFGTTIFGEIRINESIKTLEDQAKEVKERFPKLTAMEAQARSALRDIEITFGSSGFEEWLQDRYLKLDIQTRQRILTVEHLIAMEFVGPSTAPELRQMAGFYFSKFKAEGLVSDLDRALYYSLMAAEKGKRKFQYLNDLGFIYMELAETDNSHWDQAVSCLRESETKQPSQQRCYYNLGVIYFFGSLRKRKSGDLNNFFLLLERARESFATALAYANWEFKPSPELGSLIHYNMACCFSRMAEKDLAASLADKTALLDQAVGHLEAASKFKQTKLETVTLDFTEPDGDLCILVKNPHYAAAAQAALEAFKQAWS